MLLLGHVLICVLVCVSFPRSGVKHINILVFGCNLSLEFVLVYIFPVRLEYEWKWVSSVISWR